MSGFGVVEVAVLGAGPAGAIAGARLASVGIDTVVIGRSGSSQAVGEVLKPSIRVRLDTCWESVSHTVRPIHEVVSRWGAADADSRYSVTHRHGPGWLVDRPRLERALLRRCTAEGAQCRNAIASDLSSGHDDWTIGLDDGGTVRARIVVDASGRSAFAVQRHGSVTSTDQLVAQTNVRVGGDTSPHLLVESQPNGWRATVPTFDGTGVVETLVRDRGCSATGEHRAAGMTVSNWTDDRLVPVGDALMAFDPLSGDGLGFGVVSAQEAANVITDALDGDESAVRRYREGAHRLFRREVERRRDAYLGEQRWADHPFWRKRHQPTA